MTNHAKERALERYGIELDCKKVSETIRSNQAKMLHRITQQKAIYQIEHKGAQILVLYHRAQRNIITVLPADHFKHKWEAFSCMQLEADLARRNVEAMEAFHKANAQARITPEDMARVGKMIEVANVSAKELAEAFKASSEQMAVITPADMERVARWLQDAKVRAKKITLRARFIFWLARVLRVSIQN